MPLNPSQPPVNDWNGLHIVAIPTTLNETERQQLDGPMASL